MRMEVYREKHGLSRSEMGRRIGVAHTTIARWECGDMLPDGDMLLRIVEATQGEVSPNDMILPPQEAA